MHPSHNKTIAYIPYTCFAATFKEQFLNLQAGVFLSLQSMLVLNVVGSLQIHLRSTWHATASSTKTRAAFFKDCMHVHVAGPGRTCKRLLASLSGADNQNKMLAIAPYVSACVVQASGMHLVSLFPPCRNGYLETNTKITKIIASKFGRTKPFY